jgi:hypothetical protein
MIQNIDEGNNINQQDEINTQLSLKKEIQNKIEGINPFEFLRKDNDFYFYKYNSISQEHPHRLITKHFYDNFSKDDFENAYIILFIGKTGDGKTTAINALFNIFKDVKINDKYRFILIKEKNKKKGQAESQTDGLHLYYIKDFNNNPIIIIDSQGLGDTRGKKYDDLLKDIFEFTFKNIIKHINTVCFIAKSIDCRLDPLTKYIFSCVTSLFSKDISKNFIFLTSFANDDTIENGPSFIESITKNNNFNDIINKFDKKWYYVVDSFIVLSRHINSLAEYSFKQFNDLYQEKIKNTQKKSINNSIKVIDFRNEVKNNIKYIIDLKQIIKTEQNKIKDIDKKLIELEGKISVLKTQIENKNMEINSIYIPDLDSLLEELETKRDIIINRLENEYEERTVRKLRYDGDCHTYCNYCETNCHENCHCYLSILILCNECIMFPGLSSECTHCGHAKYEHTIRGNKKWVYEKETVKVNNDSKIEKVNDRYWDKYYCIEDDYNRRVKNKNYQYTIFNELSKTQSELVKKKNLYMIDKAELNNGINKIISEIKAYIFNLLDIEKSIKNMALNNFHLEIENEYIENLIYNIQQIGGEQKKEIEDLTKDKIYNYIYLNLTKLSKEELNDLNDNELIKIIDELTIYN